MTNNKLEKKNHIKSNNKLNNKLNEKDQITNINELQKPDNK